MKPGPRDGAAILPFTGAFTWTTVVVPSGGSAIGPTALQDMEIDGWTGGNRSAKGTEPAWGQGDAPPAGDRGFAGPRLQPREDAHLHTGFRHLKGQRAAPPGRQRSRLLSSKQNSGYLSPSGFAGKQLSLWTQVTKEEPGGTWGLSREENEAGAGGA